MTLMAPRDRLRNPRWLAGRQAGGYSDQPVQLMLMLFSACKGNERASLRQHACMCVCASQSALAWGMRPAAKERKFRYWF